MRCSPRRTSAGACAGPISEPAVATFRSAAIDDAERLAPLVLAFRDHLGAARPTAEELEGALPAALRDPATEFCLCLADDGSAVGYTNARSFHSIWAAGLEAHLEDLFVLEAARGAGLGQRLLEFAVERMRARGARAIGLHTNEHNREGQSLYRKAGFRPQTEERWDGGREVYWTRRLDPEAIARELHSL